MAKKVMLTPEGLEDLQNEHSLLVGERRKEMAEKIKEARSYGDLSENSEYDEAKNAQAKLEARITEIEAILANYELIDTSDDSGLARLGSRVKIEMLRNGSTAEFKIVGINEANPDEGKISDESPVGMALIGHAVGDVVEAEAPVGQIPMKILEIS